VNIAELFVADRPEPEDGFVAAVSGAKSQGAGGFGLGPKKDSALHFLGLFQSGHAQ
jgi:hypothetical protein